MSDEGVRSRLTLPSCVAAAAAVPVLGYLLFTSAGRDDAYITYWAARSLARSGSITNYNGIHLEQSSSLLQTLVLAAANRVTTASIPALGMWLGMIAAAVTVLVTARLADRIAPGAALPAALIAAVSPFLAYWTVGGLEAPWVAALTVVTVLTAATVCADVTARSVLAMVVAVVAFVLVRPEAGLVLGCVAVAALAYALVVDRASWRGAALLLLTDVVASGALAGFREAYFHNKVPQTVSAKVGGIHAGEGWDYLRVWAGHWWMLPLYAAAAAGVALLLRRRTWPALMTVLMLVAYTGFVVLTGGDWMEAGRFLVPLVPLVAVLAGVGLRVIGRPLVVAVATIAVMASQVYGVLWVARDWSTGRPVWGSVSAAVPAADAAVAAHAPWYEQDNRVHYRDLLFLHHVEGVVDSLLQRRPTVTVASGQAGMIPYYLMQHRVHRVVFIDQGSLTTNTFTHCKQGLVKGRLGAGMSFGYWLSHTQQCRVPAPDVVYSVGTFQALPALAAQYQLVYAEPDVPISSGTTHLRGATVSAAQFVAVRKDLLPLLPPA